MNAFAKLVEAQSISPLDAEIGKLLARRASGSLDERQRETIGITGALLGVVRARGDACLSIREFAASRPFDGSITLPDADAWRDLLTSSGQCGTGDPLTPLVLDGDRIYFHRYFAAECSLASMVRERAMSEGGEAADERLLDEAFPAREGEIDLQREAARRALTSRLTVIAGGPGTGKTTTVARILGIIARTKPYARIAIAAPTGKAAARLSQAIATAQSALPDDARAAIPDGQTLHRLLGYEPWHDRFRRSANDPLVEDVIVVDEASMVDLLMMQRLFAAARAHAQIILLGDDAQLRSVEAGHVLGDICDAARDSRGALLETVVTLTRSYRFESRRGIGATAGAIRAGDADATCNALDGRYADARLIGATRTMSDLLAPVRESLDAYLACDEPRDALDALQRFRVLCAHRDGPTGVSGLNAAIERWLRARGAVARDAMYGRRPVLVTANDRATNLFNGDVGVVLTIDGETQAWFDDGRGGVRAIAPSRLPRHETAWAMTVHKSQGSEFDDVLFVLPDEDSPLLTRALLYTGVTRARRSVTVIGREERVRDAVVRVGRRSSGLVERLLA